MNKDRIEGAAKHAEGVAEEAIGKAAHDSTLTAKGVIHKVEGTAQSAIGKAKDDVKA